LLLLAKLKITKFLATFLFTPNSKNDFWLLKNKNLLLFLWKKKKKGILFFYRAARLPFGPPEQASPFPSHVCLPTRPRAWPTTAAPVRRVDAARRQRHTGGKPAGPTELRPALLSPSAPAPPSFLSPLPYLLSPVAYQSKPPDRRAIATAFELASTSRYRA
jgi:hypothetical protein